MSIFEAVSYLAKPRGVIRALELGYMAYRCANEPLAVYSCPDTCTGKGLGHGAQNPDFSSILPGYLYVGLCLDQFPKLNHFELIRAYEYVYKGPTIKFLGWLNYSVLQNTVKGSKTCVSYTYFLCTSLPYGSKGAALTGLRAVKLYLGSRYHIHKSWGPMDPISLGCGVLSSSSQRERNRAADSEVKIHSWG